jgi:hypothetical protein
MVGAVAALSIVRPAAIDVVHESIVMGELQQRMTTVNGRRLPPVVMRPTPTRIPQASQLSCVYRRGEGIFSAEQGMPPSL